MDELDDDQVRLLAAARLLFTAAGQAEQLTAVGSVDVDADRRLLEADVKTLLWQAIVLLPAGLRLDIDEITPGHSAGTSDEETPSGRNGIRDRLESAARELSHLPLHGRPAATSTLITDLSVAIARCEPKWPTADDGPRDRGPRTNGRPRS